MKKKKSDLAETGVDLRESEFPIEPYEKGIVMKGAAYPDQIQQEYKFLKGKYPDVGKAQKVVASNFPPSLALPRPHKEQPRQSLPAGKLVTQMVDAQRALGNSQLTFVFPPFGGFPNNPIFSEETRRIEEPFAFGELTQSQWASEIHLSGQTNSVDEALAIPGFPREYYPARRWPEIYPIVQLRRSDDVPQKIIWSRVHLNTFRAPEHPSGFSDLRFQVPFEVNGYTWASAGSSSPQGCAWASLAIRLEVVYSSVQNGETIRVVSQRQKNLMTPRIERPGAYRIGLFDSGVWVEGVDQLEHSVRALSGHFVEIYLVTELTLAVSPNSTLSIGGDFAERFPGSGRGENSIRVSLLAISYSGTPFTV